MAGRWASVAVHGKDAVGHDQFAAGVPRALELPAQILHVVVPVAEAGGFAKSHTVYDRGMIEARPKRWRRLC